MSEILDPTTIRNIGRAKVAQKALREGKRVLLRHKDGSWVLVKKVLIRREPESIIRVKVASEHILHSYPKSANWWEFIIEGEE